MSWSTDPETTYQRNARFNVDLAGPILDLLDAREGERVLDLGCGDGALTLQLADRGGEVIGLDASPAMVEASRDRGLESVRGDCQDLDPALGRIDAVFSNAAVHWMPDVEAVIRCVAEVLRSGGRFVAEFGGFGNVAGYRVAARSALDQNDVAELLPGWYFPSDREYRTLLEVHGFAVEHCELVPRPTPLESGTWVWFETFLGSTFDPLDGTIRKAVLDRIEGLLGPAVRDHAETWWADYVRLRVLAIWR